MPKKRIIQNPTGLGQPPGTLFQIPTERPVRITSFVYGPGKYEEKSIHSPAECPQPSPGEVCWVNVDGIHNPDILEGFASVLGLHPLTLEDMQNTGQRAKIDEIDGSLFLLVKMFSRPPSTQELQVEQVCIMLQPNLVVTFQEREGDVFEIIRERIRKGKGRVRSRGADYLAYALLDAIVDSYFTELEVLSDQIEGLEEELVDNPRRTILASLHHLRREMLRIRQAVWPLREVASTLERRENALISDELAPYLRNLYDHIIQVADTVETMRETTSVMTDVYLSSLSNKMNEVMKVLTIIATIFIPLSFIAGVTE